MEVVSHGAFARLHPTWHHPERPERMAALLDALPAWRESTRVATAAELERCHTPEHVAAIRAITQPTWVDSDTICSRTSWEAAVLAATGERTKPLELGRLSDGRPFVNVASAGLASVAARNAQPLKPRLGPLAYGVGAARAAATEAPLRATVRVDGRTDFDGRSWQVIVAVSGAFGGGSGVAEADPDDGRLDVVVLPAGSRLGLARPLSTKHRRPQTADRRR